MSGHWRTACQNKSKKRKEQGKKDFDRKLVVIEKKKEFVWPKEKFQKKKGRKQKETAGEAQSMV